MSNNEKELIKRSKNGDIEAFELLIEAYQKKIFNIALKMLGNYDDASELAQEALIRIFRSLCNFKEECLFSTWIYRITTNVCLDELRKKKKRPVLYIDEGIRNANEEICREIEDNKPTPDAVVEKKEMKEAINNAILSLSEEHRLVIILRDIHGFSYDEISEIVKCTPGTVKSRINRARQALKNILINKKELFDWISVKNNRN